MPAEVGLAGPKLQDGIDLADRIVRAPIEEVVALFVDPVEVVRDGEQLVEAPPDGADMFIGANGEWTIVEPAVSLMLDDDADYLLPLFEQGVASLEGRIPSELAENYENPLLTASFLARELGAEAIALWGSDEHIGICGGAILGRDGEILEAHSGFDADEIRRCAASRAASVHGHDDPNDLDDLLARDVVTFTRRECVVTRREGVDVMDVLDQTLKERNAAQPFDPITLWGMWAPDDEIWIARRR